MQAPNPLPPTVEKTLVSKLRFLISLQGPTLSGQKSIAKNHQEAALPPTVLLMKKAKLIIINTPPTPSERPKPTRLLSIKAGIIPAGSPVAPGQVVLMDRVTVLSPQTLREYRAASTVAKTIPTAPMSGSRQTQTAPRVWLTGLEPTADRQHLAAASPAGLILQE